MSKIRKLGSARNTKTKSLLAAAAFFVASVLAVNFVIQQNNHTDEYLVAARDLPAGSTFVASDTQAQSVNLGLSSKQYLKVSEIPAGGYLLGPIRAGQLIPRSMLASVVIDERVPLVVQSDMGLPTGLVPGASVDLWVTPVDENKIHGEPFVLVLGAEVSELIENNEMFANQNPAVELWVPVEAVGPVLGAIAAEASISLILKPTLADG
jgi:hypothetical protein